MSTIAFESKLLPDGHLYCPKELALKKNIKFKVIAVFEDLSFEASDSDIELSSLKDNSNDFLTREELDYYLNLGEL
jgi:hypothetical protein